MSGVTAMFATSLILRKKKSRACGRFTAALGYALMTYAAHLGGKMVYENRVGVDRTDGRPFPKILWRRWLNQTWRTPSQPEPYTIACPFCWFVAEIVCVQWRRPAPTLAASIRKSNWLVTTSCVHFTTLDLLCRMAE